MLCHAVYSYLQENFYKRFDGAVSITVVLKESEYKVEGLSPRLRVRDPVKLFFYFLFFAFAKKQEMLSDVHVCRKKQTFFDVLCTCKALSLSKMARLVWRYSDGAGAIIENVYKFCMEKNKSGMKLSLNRVWDRTAPSLRRKCHWMTLTRVMYGGPSSACTPLRRFCQPLIASEQSSNRVLVTLAARVSFAKISFIRSLLTHAVG